ncbi:MAG: hypothetical protein ACFFB3_20890 [Candidatus Hodarchaeota archaeon]
MVQNGKLNTRKFDLTPQEINLKADCAQQNIVMHMVDRNLRFILVNAALIQLNKELGLETNVYNRTLSEVFPFLAKHILDEYHQVVLSGKSLATEECLKFRERSFIIQTKKNPCIIDGKVYWVITIIRAVTKHYQADEEENDL